MSGFVAIVNTNGAPVDRGLLEKLTASLCFKGPDQQRIWVDGPVGFGHTLFRTTDEAQYENQPASLDNKVWITGCIRIDGRKDLVDKLGMNRKIQLPQTPDSELVLHAYHAWGENCLEYLLGDFSFVLWDSGQRKLYCGIDRFAMRQLYYSQTGSIFIVSNSMHCMRQHPSVSGRLNDEAIGNFLLFGDHRWVDKTQTAFNDIRTLQPAHYLVLENEAPRSQRYWNIPVDVPLLSYRREQEYLDHFQDIFKTVVTDRLRTSKVVIFLSGGIDSSSIAATVRRIQREDNVSVELNAVTVLYDSILPSDERYYVDLVARSIQLSPHYMDGGKYPFMSPPVLTTHPLELYQPALWLEAERKAGRMGRVLLTGEAGDNLFSFSSLFHPLKELNPVHVLKAVFQLKRLYKVYPGLGTGLRAKMKRLLKRTDAFPYPYPLWLNPEFEKKLDLKKKWSEKWREPTRSVHGRHPVIYKHLLNPDWNTDDVYMNIDFVLSEKRDPFLDPRLVEFVLSLPVVPWLFKKHILRKSMHGVLPEGITRRPKTALGDIHTPLLKQAEPEDINHWLATREIMYYIDRTGVPWLNGRGCEPAETYLNLRPFLLNNWLQELHKQDRI